MTKEEKENKTFPLSLTSKSSFVVVFWGGSLVLSSGLLLLHGWRQQRALMEAADTRRASVSKVKKKTRGRSKVRHGFPVFIGAFIDVYVYTCAGVDFQVVASRRLDRVGDLKQGCV